VNPHIRIACAVIVRLPHVLTAGELLPCTAGHAARGEAGLGVVSGAHETVGGRCIHDGNAVAST